LVVVSNTSPLVALAHLGELDLLTQILGIPLLIPPAVAAEFGQTLPPWIEVRKLGQPVATQILAASLGAGESEAIGLALEIKAELILLDDLAARRLAIVLGVPLIGTLGLLLRAKEAGLIPSVRSRMDALLSLPFYIAPRLYQDVSRAAGEWES